MRILLVHNFYGSSAPSGENRVVLEERDLLRSAGCEVLEHFTHSDTVRDRGLFPMLGAALLTPWNSAARNRLRRRILEVAPDVMHVHNVFPLLSPSIFGAARGTRTAVVNTLHNYRTVCPAAVPLRDGAVCTTCIDNQSVAPALRYGCYRNSRLATVPLAASVALHRRINTYARHVDAFIALTEFQKSVLARGGLPARRIHVKPNCYPKAAQQVPWAEREDKAVFLGRISAEKGLDTLVRAWTQWGSGAPRLEIIGDGPDLDRLRGSVRSSGRIAFLGGRPIEEAHRLLSTARLLVVPSTWFEGFPLVLCEAFAFGVPVLASRLGTFEELVEAAGAGRLFAPGDSEDLRQVASDLWQKPSALERMSQAAAQEFENRYSAAKSVDLLKSIYQRAIRTRSATLGMAVVCPAGVTT